MLRPKWGLRSSNSQLSEFFSNSISRFCNLNYSFICRLPAPHFRVASSVHNYHPKEAITLNWTFSSLWQLSSPNIYSVLEPEKAAMPTSDLEKSTMADHDPNLTEVNETGHIQELERNFSLFSICSVGIVTGNTWAALGGSIAVAI